jgi:uncharacterized protein
MPVILLRSIIYFSSPFVLFGKVETGSASHLVRLRKGRYSAFPGNLQSARFVRCETAGKRLEATVIEGYRRIRSGVGNGTTASRRTRRSIGRSLAALGVGAMVFMPLFAAATTDAELATNARLLTSVRNQDSSGVARALHDCAAVNSRTRLGQSGLLLALEKNRVDIAQALLMAGADVNLPAINGVTPLMAAAYGGHVVMLQALLARGADPAATDRLGKNAITYAAGEGHAEIVRMLLATGVDPNAVYRNSLTALMWAAGYGHAETARVLLDAGARVDVVDNRGKTALDMAREFKHADTIEVLERALRASPH